MSFYKDESLDGLAEKGNVAQFVSFQPADKGKLVQRFSRVSGFPPNHEFSSPAAAIQALLAASSERSLNIRSFIPDDPRSKEFIYALKDPSEILDHMIRLADAGLYLIVNETVDVADGGVSGVIQGGVIEFAPNDTPRCVEKPGVTSLSAQLGMRLLQTVYGFRPELNPTLDERIEFSIHPRVRGWKQTTTLTWERELGFHTSPPAQMSWPNRFSQHLGDKAFGLLIAHELGCAVPRTLVIGRRVAPFSFGTDTGSVEVWTRTCPFTPQPGLFTTLKGWSDPFSLLAKEDPNGGEIASVLCQAAVPAQYSGAAIVGRDGQLIIEGHSGEGDRLMLGLEHPEQLPELVIEHVEAVFSKLFSTLGAVRFEWVHDGSQIWIVQLHKGKTETIGNILVPGEREHWQAIDASLTLGEIRHMISRLDSDVGIILTGDVGLTSHIADVIRKAGRPARIERA